MLSICYVLTRLLVFLIDGLLRAGRSVARWRTQVPRFVTGCRLVLVSLLSGWVWVYRSCMVVLVCGYRGMYRVSVCRV